MKNKQTLRSSDDLEEMIYGMLPDITMEQLAAVASIVVGHRVTFKEEDGSGGVISDIVVHWDEPITKVIVA